MLLKITYGLLPLFLCGSSALAADIPDYPFVFVIGKADIDTPPDIATCSLTLRARDQDAGKAAGTVAERLNMVLTTLKANHISPNDIESFNIQKQAVTSENINDDGPATIRGYDVWRSLKFVARQLDSIAAIETSLVKSANITDINCRFDRTDRSAIEADLQSKALHSARAEADKLAEPLGRHIAAVVALSKVPFESIPDAFGFGGRGTDLEEKFNRMFKRSIDSDVLQGDDLLVPSTIHLSVSVNALFKIE